MRKLAAVLFVGGLLAVASFTAAQPPGGQKEKGKGGDKEKGSKGEKGGPGGFRPPAPGQIMPVFLQDELKLTDAQKKELDAMQKDVDAKLEKLLTAEQRKAFQAMKERGPGGFPGGNPPPKQ